jgi:hypothetical protein
MTVVNDLTNRIDRLAVAYGRHIVKGTLTKHVLAATGGGPSGDTALLSGVALTAQSVAAGEWKFYFIVVPSGATLLEVVATGSGDAALYTRSGAQPDLSTHDCRAYTASPQTCSHASPAAATWWIGVYGHAGGASYTIEATITGGGVPSPPGGDPKPNQETIQVALGLASLWNSVDQKFFCRGWDSIEKLYYQGFEIPSDNYSFHGGGPADAPDAYFPDDIAHPKAAYYAAQLPQGMSADTPDQMAGIFKTLKVANYNSSGVQIQSDGSAIPGGADPDDYLFFSANPALVVADLKRRTRRSLVTINWPSWCAWRDYCATLIDWDDGALTPHQVSLAAAAGGSLTPGTHIWVRIATLKGGDISSASKDRADDGFNTASAVVGSGGAIIVEWADQSGRGSTAYRVYVGTAEGAEDRYFTVSDGATNTLTITTLTGATMGAPPDIATGALLRQIPRFEAHVFFVPPFDFSAALDRIAQITCMDWQYAGGLLNFLTPEVRDPVFTVNLAECTGFKTYKTDRRQRYNQIVVTYRDLDDPYLAQADPPVEINRFDLQAKEGVRPFQIDMGCSYRSQAERVGNNWARRLIDSDQMVEIEGSPKMYGVLPGDPINVTHDVPDWTDVQFYIEAKEEPEDTKADYPMTGRIYGAWYSDTDHKPLPSPLPPARLNPFAAPPVVTSCTLTEAAVELTNGAPFTVIQGAVQFAAFVGEQIGRVWHEAPGGAYVATDRTLIPDPTTLQAAFELNGIDIGTHKIKVVTESRLGVSLVFGDHPEFSVDITGDLIRPRMVSDPVVSTDAFGDFLITFIGHPRTSEQPETYVVQIWDSTGRTDPGTHMKGTLPVTPGINHASLLNSVHTGRAGAVGVPPDEESGGAGAGAYTVVTSAATDKNNLFSLPWDGDVGPLLGEPVSGVTLEFLSKTYTRFDFSLQSLNRNLSGTVNIVVGLQTRANADPVSDEFAPDLSACPLSVSTSPGTLAGTIKLTFKSFGTEIAGSAIDDVDPGFGSGSGISDVVVLRLGPRFRFEVSGTEYRLTINPDTRNLPHVIVASGPSGPAFPLRLIAKTGSSKIGSMAVLQIVSGGDFLATTYSVRDQVAKEGSQQSRVYLRIFEKSKYNQIADGLPLDIVAPPL